MSLLLHLETATETCSVALSENGLLLSFKEITESKVHATLLNQFIIDVLNESQKSFKEIAAVAVSKGPGSYTGLRIGVASAKGICFALNIPLISVNTLETFTNYFIQQNQFIFDESNEHTLFCPLLDARRMEVYTAIFNHKLKNVIETNALILDKNSFENLLSKNKIHFFGSGSDKAIALLKHQPNAVFHAGINTSAKGMIDIATKKFLQTDFENLAYFEPFYLKEFIGTVPKKQL